MANLEESFPVPFPISRVWEGMLEQVDKFDWTMMDQGPGHFRARQDGHGSSYPLEVSLLLSPSLRGCIVTVKASSGGSGPVEEEYVKRELDRLLFGLRVYLEQGSG